MNCLALYRFLLSSALIAATGSAFTIAQETTPATVAATDSVSIEVKFPESKVDDSKPRESKPNESKSNDVKSEEPKSKNKKANEDTPKPMVESEKPTSDSVTEAMPSEEPAKKLDKPVKVEPPVKKVLPHYGSNKNPFISGQPWRIHDLKRPRPHAVSPGETDDAPPADAIVLFGGKDLSEWYHVGSEDELYEAQWKIEDGYFEIEPKTGSIYTIDSFGSCQLHIEWMIPQGIQGTSQHRGNSGIKLMERYEVQVLDSFDSRTYADGQAGSIYGQYPPLVNAVREPGKWQSYDIVFEAPLYESEKLVRPPYISVIHNGVLVHHHRELPGPTGLRAAPNEAIPPAAPLMLQDHGNRIRYRNIWIRELK